MQRLTLFAFAASLALGGVLLGSGCSDDDNGNNNGNNNNELPPPQLTAVTYNGGLARGFVDWADERAQQVADAVANLEAEVVCVQEFWQPEHVTMLADAAAATLPNQIFLEPMPDENPGDPACSSDATEFQAFESCARNNCGTVPPADLVGCVLGSCSAEFGAITPECSQCIAANVGGTIDDAVNACTTASEAYAYGGSFGIGLLTSETIATSDSSVFASTYNRRAVIHAELQTDALGTVHVFCTHLTAIFSSIPWPKPTGSWQEEQMLQITEMRSYMDSIAGSDSMVILMGDFNTGPAGGDWVAEYADNFNALAEGFTVPFPASPNAACTFCDSNPLNGGIDHGTSVLIDHILYRGFAGTTTAQRVLDEPIQITADGTPLDTAYSDHYGVSVTFSN